VSWIEWEISGLFVTFDWTVTSHPDWIAKYYLDCNPIIIGWYKFDFWIVLASDVMTLSLRYTSAFPWSSVGKLTIIYKNAGELLVLEESWSWHKDFGHTGTLGWSREWSSFGSQDLQERRLLVAKSMVGLSKSHQREGHACPVR
jgi:hypothetical protein